MSKSILVVDDDPHIVRLVQVTLEREGYGVRVALDGAKALEAVAAERPDLVICDVIMPGIGGFEVVRHLRTNPATADLPILMLTARETNTDIADGWRLGVDTYLTKPFDAVELLAFARRLVPQGE